jgi:uncharacterized Zn-finger protein
MITDKKANIQTVELEGDQLPACCPNPKMPVWSHHPKVFLDVTKTGQAVCPYCGTAYRLKPGAKVHSH